MRCCFPFTDGYNQKEWKLTHVDKGVLEPLYIAGWNVKWCKCLENSWAVTQKVKFRVTTLLYNPFLGIYLIELKTGLRFLHPNIHLQDYSQ